MKSTEFNCSKQEQTLQFCEISVNQFSELHLFQKHIFPTDH